ncbi:tyrosine-type recombinase/integrase [Baekduia soli]|uniref:Tyrosine-type recombinase/integrase n=1 Tax=Baekduia soli TaxID=496014 RepID=A0A5B8UB89_9ACTN|nr:tyrosine-type recombinase/integrase [Baekduia soli]QEC50453.1 tyrosine-type recombinase/integrase [Baekduia soli]
MSAVAPDLRSIERRRHRRTDGTVLESYRVRWAGPDGRRLSRAFDALEAAVAFRDELDRRAALIADGPSGRRSMTVADCYELWMREHVVPELALRTQNNYGGVWRRHLADRVGAELAIDVRPRHIKALRGDMLADGLGPQTVRKALQTLGALFAHALELDIVEINPVPQIRKPRVGSTRQVEVVDIATVERMRFIALDREGSPLTAIAISLGYLAGLRPGEWRALRWRDIREASLVVRDSTDVDGSLRGRTKTGRDRSIDLWSALAGDLAEWRALTPFAEPGDPIVPNGRRRHWSDDEAKRWGRRTFRRVALAAGWVDAAPNKLRHLHASLLIKEGRLDSREIASRMGHSIEMLENRYAHEIREYRGRRICIDDEIRLAREVATDVSASYRASTLAISLST